MISPAMFDALADIGVAAAGSAMTIPLRSGIKWLTRRQTPKIDIKLTSGKAIQLEVDPLLSTEKVSALVLAAVTSANAGDAAGVEKVIAESRAASRAVREAATASS